MPTYPNSYNLRQAAKRIINGGGGGDGGLRCLVVPWGDSILDVGNQYNLGNALRSALRPRRWSGAYIHPDSGNDSALGRYFSSGGAFTGATPAGTLTYEDQCTAAGNLVTRFIYPKGAPTRALCLARITSMVTASTHAVLGGSTLAVPTVAVLQASSFNGTGNWTIGRDIKADTVVYKNPLGFNNVGGGVVDTFSLTPQRSGSASGTVVSGQTCFAANDAACAFAKYSCTITSGAGQARVLIQTGAGNTTGLSRNFWVAGTRFYDAAGDYGTEMSQSCANGSSAATDMLDALSNANDNASFAAACGWTEGAVFLFMPGTNMTSAEANDILGIWKAKVLACIDAKRTAVMATVGAVRPLFVLVPVYESNSVNNARSLLMQQALYEIAQANADCSFLNLATLALPFADLDASDYLQSDNIHPSFNRTDSVTNGMDYFAGLIAREISVAAADTSRRLRNRL